MPTAETKPEVIRRNFTMPRADSDRIDELARLIDPDSPEPNASLAVRTAVREAIEQRTKRKR